MKIKLLSLGLCVLLLQACTSIEWRPVASVMQQHAVLITDGVSIEEVGGVWRLRSGETAFPPVVQDAGVRQVFVDGIPGRMQGMSPITQYITTDYNTVLNAVGAGPNAFDVRVNTADGQEPLYGKMVFFSARPDMTETSAKRAWTVAVPDSYVAVARQGQVSVVYQPARLTNGQDVATWILWLSSYPL